MSAADVFGIHAEFWQIVYRSAIIYAAIVVGVRISGRRHLGQMTPFDLVLVLLIANAVQNAMVGSDVTIFGGLTAAATLIAMNQASLFVTNRVSFFRRALEGEPSLLVNDGNFIDKHLSTQGITRDMVLQAIREHGFEDESQIKMAVLEVDGTISIVPQGADTIRTRRRVRTILTGGN